ncbi:Spc98 family-domain-containing protein [Phaeosphaeriaceae sp. PMI808]|nr:Spc98 family-domain-containing protein [Phaeosphaeriaceae sp. PMI808]
MAQNAKISALTDDLIHSILDFDPATNRQAYKHAKEIASRGLRGHQYARTNQFDVSSSFTGLGEKFRIKSRDDLADALQLRVQKLEGLTSRFKPDFLSLLLHLSDRPLENTRVDALKLLPSLSPPPSPLTWKEILDDDPYSDEDIWKDIDYAADSSADEQTSKRPGKTKPSPPTSLEEEDLHDPETCIVPGEPNLIQELQDLQFWRRPVDDRGSKTEITELQAVRETLFMLAGLQTSLYQLDKEQNNIRINPRYVLSHAMTTTVDHLLSELVDIGKEIYRLRQWTKQSSTLPLIQTFEATVRSRLVSYDRSLASLQQQYLTPITLVAVSLLELHLNVCSISAPPLCLTKIVFDTEPNLLANPFGQLEALFDQITIAQMTLQTENFQYLACVFFECLSTYLKPIRTWMEVGELGLNDETFFVFQSDPGSDISSLWHDRYILRRDAQNELRSPSFLKPAVKKIFNTGKSIIFLKELGIHGTGTSNIESEPRLDHATICGISEEVPLSPFPELFQAAFDNWMQSKYSQASTVLRQYLMDTGGLMRTLVILETLYLGKNGAIFEDFANSLFERMDAKRRGWNDRYVLTEITRGIFGTMMPLSEIEKISVRSLKVKGSARSVTGLATVSLDFALPWPLQNIIQRTSIATYQKVFTFLLQAYRVKYVLQRTRPTRTSRQRDPTAQLVYKLQHRLTWFIDVLRSYLTETAIFFTTQEMDSSMVKAEDIDEMAQVHLNNIVKLQDRALLSKDVNPIYKAIIEILDLGVTLSKTISSKDTEGVKSVTARAKSSSQRSTPVPTAVDLLDSETGEDGEEEGLPKVSKSDVEQDPKKSLRMIDEEFGRLLSFVTVGLRSVGRVGAEPMWEQLGERLAWEGKKDRV